MWQLFVWNESFGTITPISRPEASRVIATLVAAGSDPVVRSNQLPPTTIGERRPRAQGDPGLDVLEHPRRMGSPAEGVSHTLMSFPGTRATSPDTGIGHDDDVVSGVSPHCAGCSLSHPAPSLVVGVPREDHEKVLLELSGLPMTLGKTQRALDAAQAHVQALGQTRM